MRALYKALDQGGVGLFESPTGEFRNPQAVAYLAPRLTRGSCLIRDWKDAQLDLRRAALAA